MLFNSYEFCLLFLPLALIVYSAAGRYAGRAFALGWLLLASIVFYAWSSPSALAKKRPASKPITSKPG